MPGVKSKKRRRVKVSKGYPCIRQWSEEDCGAACLASISKHYGQILSITQSREVVGTGQLGTTMLGLKRGAEALGFNARSVKASPALIDNLKEVTLPAVMHWQGHHWVVLYGKRGRKFVVADPGYGLRFLTQKELLQSWNGIMLLLEPHPELFFANQIQGQKPQGISRFLQRIWPYRGLLFQALLINIVLGVLGLTSPFLLQILTDDVLVRRDNQLLTTLVVGVVVMHIFSSNLRLLQSSLIAHFTQKLQLGLILEFGRQILRLPLSYYESRRSGEIVSRLRDINEINQLVAQVVVSLPSQFFVAIVSLGFMLFYSSQLTLVALLIALLMSLSTFPFIPTLRKKTNQVLVLSSENQGVLVETFKGALVLKATNAGAQFWDEFQMRFGRLANATFGTVQLGIWTGTFSQLISNIGSVALLAVGSQFVIREELSIGQLLAFNSMQANLLAFVAAMIALVDEYFRSQTAVGRLLEVIDATPEESNVRKPYTNILEEFDISCNNINFYHAGRVTLLDNFSLTIPGGRVIALIGRSGCGKSTLAKLIAGLYQPQAGGIRIGPYNLDDISLECWREQVVYVPQDAHFWSRSILENFQLGHPNVTFEQIVKACQIADADDFISQLPNKYQTVLGEFGANLSGGQRQRLAIARAIVNDPPILILDESTAGLDPVSEGVVLDRLLHHRRGKTTIMISHRPATINRADWIALINKGRLILEGDRKSLLNVPGEHLTFLSFQH
jgi:ATP-binding cassette subfamily B protein/ATP-binding cassette subfamily C protein